MRILVKVTRSPFFRKLAVYHYCRSSREVRDRCLAAIFASLLLSLPSFLVRLSLSAYLPEPSRFSSRINEILAIVKPLAGILLAHFCLPETGRIDGLRRSMIIGMRVLTAYLNSLRIRHLWLRFGSSDGGKSFFYRRRNTDRTIANETNVVRDASSVAAHSTAKVLRRLEL